MIYRFGGYSLDPGRRELRREDEILEVQPKVLDLILTLVRQRERVVTRDELLDQLWGDAAVIEGVLTTAVHAARAALDDSAARHWAIKTVARRGYRFIASVEQLAAKAQPWGARVLAAWCYEREGSPPYWPWAQLLRTAVLDGRPEDALLDLGAGAADLVTLVPALHELRPDLPEPPRLQSGPARFRLFESIASFLVNTAKRQPVLILVDDLHSADHASMRLLGFLAREIRHARILAVVTVRDGEYEMDAVLEETLAELARQFPGERIHLEGLSDSETAELVERWTGVASPSPFVDEIVRRSEGNPFFVKEIVNLLQTHEGTLDQDAAALTGAVPPGVRDVILRRLHRRSERCQRVVALCAVLGREFRRDVVESTSELASEEVAEALDEAQAAGFLQQHAGHYRFTHGLMQETLYARWNASERRHWHRRAGEALEALAASSRDASPAELAHHFLQAAGIGESEKAIDYAVRAADQAIAVHAHDEAAKHYGRALEALDFSDAPNDAQRCELLIALGTAQLDARRSDPKGRESLLDAARIARALGQHDKLARAALELAATAHRGGPGDPVVIELLESALAGLPGGDPAMKARVMADLALQLLSPPTLERAAALSEEAVALARKSGDLVTLGETLNLRCTVLSGPEHAHARLGEASALLELAGESGSAELALFAHRWRLVTLLELGEIADADREIQAYQRASDEARVWHGRWFALRWRFVSTWLPWRTRCPRSYDQQR